MAKKKMGGLGKGLDSLFADLSDDTGSEASGSTLLLREIEPDPEQPRKRFDDDALNQLADSIAENGLLQPIAVRPKKVGPGYIIIAGERRWRAARLAGLVEVPVIIKDVTDEQAAALALIENLQREDLDPIEVAEGCRQLIDKYGLTQESAAKRLGKSRSAVANSLRLLALPEDVRRLVSEGKLSFGHAKVLLGLPDEELMRQAAATLDYTPSEAELHEAVEQQIQTMEAQLAQRGLRLEDYCKFAGATPESLREDARADAEQALRMQKAVDRIAILEGLRASQKDLDDAMQVIARENGLSLDQLKGYCDDNFNRAVENSVLSTKAYALVRALADVTEITVGGQK